MAMTKQEKLDKKAEALYEKKHKKRYKKSTSGGACNVGI